MSVEIVWQGKFLTVKQDGTWEYVARRGDLHAAVILAIDDAHVILVEQYRMPLGRRCLELPAGIVGDEDAGESVARSAARELEEETGYRAAAIQVLGDYMSSPGLTSEGFTLVRAIGLTQIGPGGGIDGEDITVHRVALAELSAFVAAKREQGVAIDVRMLVLLGGGLLG